MDSYFRNVRFGTILNTGVIMRGTKAKMLRKLSFDMTVELPLRNYIDKALNPRRPTRRTRFLYECSRLVYRNLKKSYKALQQKKVSSVKVRS